jgi:hypothetical protein
MIEVFVWPFVDKDTWGHASMRVNGGTPLGQEYISWWPNGSRQSKALSLGGNLYCAGAIPNQTFDDDVRGENRTLPGQTIKIEGKTRSSPGLDETAIKAWWRNLTTVGSTKWCTLGPNCSTVVAYGLTVGGASEFSDMWSSSNIVWTPNSVATFARAIRSGIAYARLPRSGAASPRDLDGGVPPGGL